MKHQRNLHILLHWDLLQAYMFVWKLSNSASELIRVVLQDASERSCCKLFVCAGCYKSCWTLRCWKVSQPQIPYCRVDAARLILVGWLGLFQALFRFWETDWLILVGLIDWLCQSSEFNSNFYSDGRTPKTSTWLDDVGMGAWNDEVQTKILPGLTTEIHTHCQNVAKVN